MRLLKKEKILVQNKIYIDSREESKILYAMWNYKKYSIESSHRDNQITTHNINCYL
jgi:hypothetical protein